MDLAALLTAPVIAIAAGLVIISAWIGHAVGKSNENKRKQQALTQADEAAQQALETLRQESQEKLDVLSKAGANDMENLKKTQAEQVHQLHRAHQTLVDSLKSTHADEIERLNVEHSGLINRLNATNNANINDLEGRRQAEMQQIKADNSASLATLKNEHRAALEELRAGHGQALRQLQAEAERRLAEAEERQAKEVDRLQAQIAEIQAERDTLRSRIAETDRTVTDLRDEIREGRLNNMFSVSKSGEKLVRVVRSVQELASELDETSRTVTNGEYSFFDEIKDQRDRETLLRLAGGAQTYPYEQTDAPSAAGEASDTQKPDDEAIDQWMDSADEETDPAKAPH